MERGKRLIELTVLQNMQDLMSRVNENTLLEKVHLHPIEALSRFQNHRSSDSNLFGIETVLK